MFDNLSNRLDGIVKRLRGKGRLTEADVDEVMKEIRSALLEADVNVTVVRSVCNRIREHAIGATRSQALDPGQQVVKGVHDELIRILGGETLKINYASKPPTVVLMAGLQGSGKTTASGKLALWFKSQGRNPLLVGADLQRPAAVEQLRTLGRQVDVPVYSDPEDPVLTAFQGVEEAKRLGRDVVIVDTAGRLAIDKEMMEQVRLISGAVSPHYTFLVIDAMTGQDAVQTAEAFHHTLQISGVILSKLDGDARGGAALSVKEVIGRPIAFASTGEKLDAFEQFHPDRMAGRILGMGDVLTLIEQAERAFEADQAEKAAARLMEGEFTLDDFLEQMQSIKKMGSLSSLLGMMPGMPKEIKNAKISDDDLKPIEAIIRSMTLPGACPPPDRQRQPSRPHRHGSGTDPGDVTRLIKQFGDMQKMMKRMGMGGGKKGKRGMPGMGGLGGKNMPDMAELEQMMGGRRAVSPLTDPPTTRPRARATSSPPLSSNVASTASSVLEQEIDVLGVEHQWRPQLEHVRVAAGHAGEDARDSAASEASRLASAYETGSRSSAVGDQVDTPEQAAALHVADHVVPGRQVGEASSEQRAGRGRVGQQLLVGDHVEHGERHRGRDRVAPERVEVVATFGEAGGDLRRRDDSCHRMTGAHRLADRHDVGDEAVVGVAPEVATEPAVAGLHLVGDHEPSGGADRRRDAVDVVVGRDQDAVRVPARVDQHGGDAVPALVELGQRVADEPRVSGAELGLGRTERPAVGVRRLDHAQPVRPLGFGIRVGRQLADEVGVAVVRALGDDDTVVARDHPRDLHREVVGLRAGAHEIAARQVAGKARRQALRQLDDVLVEVARVRVEQAGLLGERGDDARVGMADRGHVVVAVEIALAVGVEQPHPLAAHQMHRLVVEQLVAGGEGGGAPAQQLGVGVAGHRCLHDRGGGTGGIDVEPPRQRGVRAWPLAGDVRGEVRHVDDLVLDEQRAQHEPRQHQVGDRLHLVVGERAPGVVAGGERGERRARDRAGVARGWRPKRRRRRR